MLVHVLVSNPNENYGKFSGKCVRVGRQNVAVCSHKTIAIIDNFISLFFLKHVKGTELTIKRDDWQ